MLPENYVTFEAYFRDALAFLKEYDWLYSCPVTEILINDILNKIPSEWCEALLTLSNEELNQLPTGYIKDDWPESLKYFCKMCQKLKSEVKTYVLKEELYCIPSIICHRLSEKKLHEICHLAQVIHDECQSGGIRRIVDFGSGMGYVGQLLHAKYGYTVLGLEARPELVEAAARRQTKICSAAQVVYTTVEVNSDTEGNIAQIIEDKMPPDCLHQCHSDWPGGDIIYNLKSAKKNKNSSEKSKMGIISKGRSGSKGLIKITESRTTDHCCEMNCCPSKDKTKYDNIGHINVNTANDGKVYSQETESNVTSLCADNTAKVSTKPDSGRTIKREAQDSVCLIGLHACADLSANAAKIFAMVPTIRRLIIVPCCYHKMSATTSSEREDIYHRPNLALTDNFKRPSVQSTKQEKINFFPMSSTLKQCIKEFPSKFHVVLQKPFLRLAAQETGIRWKSASKEVHDIHALNLMARAVLYLCAYEGGYNVLKKHRHGVRKTENSKFGAVLDDMVSRYTFTAASSGTEVANEEVRQKILVLWDRHKNLCSLAEVFTALQLTIQGTAESFVLLDKIAYLKETTSYHVSCDLTKVMNEQISPRCHTIIARKESL
ncbi:probable methyltransferase-like protein 25 [Schistocerca gregaria]|uniref:probable methyltransferase-like protein 25 n=1 Tax=Schistocerca gregaria TaxID=7010 RepID=UPI00211F1533|nr:probable methyltransferase-like protein 25 [Schistocerca gregaria]